MQISLIAAMAENRVIGGNNQLLWHLPADLKHFKALTLGKPIIMGRKTYMAIGQALSGRLNIIITQDTHFKAQSCVVVSSLAAALKAAGTVAEVMIIGGGQIYQASLPLATQIYLTIVHHEFKGDTYFPELSVQDWQLLTQEDFACDEKNPYAYSFLKYQRLA